MQKAVTKFASLRTLRLENFHKKKSHTKKTQIFIENRKFILLDYLTFNF
jgi:hypothetical protein